MALFMHGVNTFYIAFMDLISNRKISCSFWSSEFRSSLEEQYHGELRNR